MHRHIPISMKVDLCKVDVFLSSRGETMPLGIKQYDTQVENLYGVVAVQPVFTGQRGDDEHRRIVWSSSSQRGI